MCLKASLRIGRKNTPLRYDGEIEGARESKHKLQDKIMRSGGSIPVQ